MNIQAAAAWVAVLGAVAGAVRWIYKMVRGRKGESFLAIILAAALLVGAGAIAGVLLLNPMQPAPEAPHEFLVGYYHAATTAATRRQTWRDDLTPQLRRGPNQSFQSYTAWWELWSEVKVNRVTDTPGNPMEFRVRITYRRPRQAVQETETITLTCHGFVATIVGHTRWGCPAGSLQILSAYTITPGH